MICQVRKNQQKDPTRLGYEIGKTSSDKKELKNETVFVSVNGKGKKFKVKSTPRKEIILSYYVDASKIEDKVTNRSQHYSMMYNYSRFNGYCYTCHTYGHRARSCRNHTRNNFEWNKNKSSWRHSNQNHNIIYFKCNNFGDKTLFCGNSFVKSSKDNMKMKMVWKIKQRQKGIPSSVHTSQAILQIS